MNNAADEFDELLNAVELTAGEGGVRIDLFVAESTDKTRAYAQKLIESGHVELNGKSCTKAGTKLKEGDSVFVELPPPSITQIVPEDIPINIVYEDGFIAVIDKQKGMVVHPAPGNYTGTLVNALMYRLKDLSGIGGELRPGIVHRIDKLTSGLIVVAKNDEAHTSLASQMKAHTAKRTYVAIVSGNIKQDEGTVDAPIGRHPRDRKKMAVVADGRSAVTHFQVIERYGEYTLIAARLETGRTHQIRVHMAHIKHPVAGDTVYSNEKNRLSLDGQALHAARLELVHPATGETMIFRADIPDWFKAALKRAGRDEKEDIESILNRVL